MPEPRKRIRSLTTQWRLFAGPRMRSVGGAPTVTVTVVVSDSSSSSVTRRRTVRTPAVSYRNDGRAAVESS